MAFRDNVGKIAKEEAQKLVQQYYATKKQNDCCVQPLLLLADNKAQLPDGTIVNVITRGLPGTYAEGIKVNDTTWIANVEEMHSVDVGEESHSPQWTLGQFANQQMGPDVIYEEKTGKYWGPPWDLLSPPENLAGNQGVCIIRSADGKDLYFQKAESPGQASLDGATLTVPGGTDIALQISWGIIENIKFTSTGEQQRYVDTPFIAGYGQDIIETLGYSKLTTGIYTLTFDELIAQGGIFHNTPFPGPTNDQTILTGLTPTISGFTPFSINAESSDGSLSISMPTSGALKRIPNGFQLVLITSLSWSYFYNQNEKTDITIPLFVPDVPNNICGGCNCSKTLSGETFITTIDGSTQERGLLLLSMSLGSSFTPSYIQTVRLDKLTPVVSGSTTFTSVPVLFGCSVDGPDIVQFDGSILHTCIGFPVIPLFSCQRTGTDFNYTTPLVLTEPLGESGIDPAIYGLNLYNTINPPIIIPTSESGEYIIFLYGQTGGLVDTPFSPQEIGPAFASSIGFTFGGGAHSISTVFGTVQTHDPNFLNTTVNGALPSFGRVLPTFGGLLTHVENITDEVGTFLFDKNCSKVNFLSNTVLLDQEGNIVPDPLVAESNVGSTVSPSLTYTIEKFSVLQGTGVAQATPQNLSKISTREGALTKFPSYPSISYSFGTPVGATGVSKNSAVFPQPPTTFQTQFITYYSNVFYFGTDVISGNRSFVFNPNRANLSSFPHRNNSVLPSGVLLT